MASGHLLIANHIFRCPRRRVNPNNPTGTLATQTDAKGQTLTFAYDALDRLTGKAYSTGQVAAQYRYDEAAAVNGKGRRTAMGDGPATSTWRYDARGNVARTEQGVAGVSGTLVLAQTYDSADRVATLTHPGGEVLTYAYDAAWRQAGVCSSLGGCYAQGATYTALDQPATTPLGNGLTDTRTYNGPTARLARLQVGPGGVLDRAYTYDPVGNVRAIADNLIGQTQTFGYDHRDRLTHAGAAPAAPGGAPAPYDEAYAYDTVGNFTSKAGVAYAGYGAGTGNSGHAHAPATVGGQAYAYDANGNVTSGGGRTYVWDANNQPTSIVGPDGVTETYGYDADGGRVSRARAGVTTVYLGGAWEQDVQSGASTKTRAFVALQGRGIAQRERVASPVADTTIYLHGDHLGSVSAATSGSGAVLSRQAFTPWGELRAGGGDVTQTTRDFTGQKKDDTGLLFSNARYYDPKLGRFLSADSIVPGMASGKGGAAATLGQDGGAALRPLTTDFHEPGFAATLAREDAFTQAKGFRFQLRDEDRRQGAGAQWQWGPQNPQALDRYSYVLNNPLRYTDPSGHFIIAIPAAVAALFTAEVLADVVALFVVYSFVTAVITCSQDPGCSSVLGRFADQLNQGAITVQQFLGEVQRSLAKKADIKFIDDLARDYNLTREQRRELHDAITGQHYTQEEIEAEAKAIADRDGNEYQPRRR